MHKGVIKRTTLKNQVYEYLKEQIIFGTFKPGERLIEEKIADTLEVSRSPIREAIRMLEKDGFVTVNRSGGVNVVNPAIDDYKYLYEFRKEVESTAAYYAAQRRTNEQLEIMEAHLKTIDSGALKDYKLIHQSAVDFHSAIAKASKNPFLIFTLSQMQGINAFYRRAILDYSEQYVKKAVGEHEQIFKAIKDGDEEIAKELMRRHIENDYIRFHGLYRKNEN